jgi:hypothetical protein
MGSRRRKNISRLRTANKVVTISGYKIDDTGFKIQASNIIFITQKCEMCADLTTIGQNYLEYGYCSVVQNTGTFSAHGEKKLTYEH